MAVSVEQRGRRTRALKARAALVALSVVGYVVLSRKLGEQYPFGPLTMFSGGLRVASRIVARAPDGRLCELSAFEAWSCEGRPDFSAAANPQCHMGAEHPENDRKAEALVRAPPPGGSRGGDPVRVEVIRRGFRVKHPGGPIEIEDCVLVTCSAREVAGQCASTP